MTTQGHQISLLGVHLAGAGSSHTGLVRASVACNSAVLGVVKSLHSDARMQAQVDSLFRYLKEKSSSSGLPASVHAETNLQEELVPLSVSAFSAHIGPLPQQDADAHFWDEVLALGPVPDIVVIDAPLSLPPCVNCQLPCPGTLACSVSEVQMMVEHWRAAQKINHKTRLPQPYLERLFEVFGKFQLRAPDALLGHEFVSVLGSNKAPLTARALRIVKEVRCRNPRALVLESHPYLGPMGWALAVGLDPLVYRQFKLSKKSYVEREKLIKKMQSSAYVVLPENQKMSPVQECAGKPELFAALMAALTGWGLLSGRIFLGANEVLPSAPHPFICLPHEIVRYLVGSPATPVLM